MSWDVFDVVHGLAYVRGLWRWGQSYDPRLVRAIQLEHDLIALALR